jgi:small GTP-binding protein
LEHLPHDCWQKNCTNTTMSEHVKDLKLVVLGDGNVGKTSLLYVYAHNEFPEKYIPTVFDNFFANVQKDGTTFRFGLYDTAGQEDYENIRKLSYPNSNVFLICFSVTSKDSLIHVKEKWYKELCQNCNIKEVACILVGLKSDMRDSTSTTIEEAEKIRKELGFCEYIECSAKTRHNVQYVFDKAVDYVFNKKQATAKSNRKDCIVS